MRTPLTIVVVMVVALVALSAQSQLFTHGGRVQIRSTAANALTVFGGAGIGITGTPASTFDVRSAANGAGGVNGMRVSRSDGSYLILNMDAGGATSVASVQAGDPGNYRPLHLSPLGGGIRVGTTDTASLVNSIIAASVTYDPPSIADLGTTAASPTVFGATTGSVCSAGLSSMAGVDMTMTAQASAVNTVRVTIFNKTGAAVDLASGTLRVVCVNVP